MGAGRAIVSTPYPYAAELLADGRGVLVPAATPSAGRRRSRLLDDDPLRAAMGGAAHEHSRRMVWSDVGAQYRRLFARVGARPQRWPRRHPGFPPLNA